MEHEMGRAGDEGAGAIREERDSLGTFLVPADALYGVQTARAVHNFPISGLRAWPALVDAIVTIKKAAACANRDLNRLADEKAEAIVRAADEILAGQHRDQFVVDVYQAGAGTSFNMNANEVLANRANEILGMSRGDYRSGVHANDEVNMAQSTNDVFPDRDAARGPDPGQAADRAGGCAGRRAPGQGPGVRGRAQSGRTHLQDAVPIRLGQEFTAYGNAVAKAAERIARASDALADLGIGGTAAGTGLNAGPQYPPARRAVSARVHRSAGPGRKRPGRADAKPGRRGRVLRHAALAGLELTRIANDLRLLASGPRTGLAEILLPPVQPGSSIMPGKVNPVMAEMLNMVCYQVLGCDTTIAYATQAGQLELNVMMPVMAWNLLLAETILRNALHVFTERCVVGITADPAQCGYFLDRSVGLATILNETIGYDAAAQVAKDSVATGKSIRELVLERGLLTGAEMDAIVGDTRQT
jgi:aspartate ammonia-lyase